MQSAGLGLVLRLSWPWPLCWVWVSEWKPIICFCSSSCKNIPFSHVRPHMWGVLLCVRRNLPSTLTAVLTCHAPQIVAGLNGRPACGCIHSITIREWTAVTAVRSILTVANGHKESRSSEGVELNVLVSFPQLLILGFVSWDGHH